MYGMWRRAYQTIEAHDGLAYIVWHDFAADEPIEMRSWYPTTSGVIGIRQRFGGDVFGTEVQRDGYGYTLKVGDITGRLQLADGGQTMPAPMSAEMTRSPLDCPKQRGKVYPTHYKNGYWYKDAPKRGYVRL